MTDSPTCDLCGAEITSGFMFLTCAYGDKCYLFPRGAPEETQAFARKLIAGNGNITVSGDG